MGVLLINSNISLDKIVYFDIIHPSKDNNVIQITYLINKQHKRKNYVWSKQSYHRRLYGK